MSAASNDGRSRRTDKIRVAVLFGGQSAEHDVSLRSAQTVIGALDPERYEVVPIGVTREGRWLSGGDPFRQLAAASPLFALGSGTAASSSAPAAAAAVTTAPGALPRGLDGEIDVVFPVLHGPMGEDGTVQGMLELAGLPYVGSGVLGSAVAMDKAMAEDGARSGGPASSAMAARRAEGLGARPGGGNGVDRPRCSVSPASSSRPTWVPASGWSRFTTAGSWRRRW